MKVIYKKIIAFICVLSMIVSTFAMNPGTVSAGTDEDGFTQLSTTENVDQALGKWSKIYKASTWAQPTDVSIKGEGTSFDDLAIKINSSNGATTGDDRWAIQAHYPVSGLDASKTYKCTIKYTSTKAGNMLYKPDGIAGRNDKIYPAVEGENTITDTITGVTGFTAVFALCGMPNGCIVDFTSISVVEESEETTTTSEPVTTLEIIDGTELLKDTEFEEGKVTHWDEYGGNKYTNQGNGKLKVEIPAYESGDNWATQLVQKNIQLYEGKWYVAQFKITSDVDKSFQLLIQSDGNSGGDWTVFAKEDVDVSAGETKTVQIQFQANQSTAANVLYGIMMGYINGASKAANVTIENVSLKVYNDEQQISGTQTVLLTSNDVSVSGFQMKTNWSEEDENQGLVGFRTVCKAPNVGGKVTVGKVSYTVAKFGTLYTIEPDKGIPDGTSFIASGTLLKSYNLNDETAETVNPFTLAATATENAIKEKDDTYSSYVQTMQDTIDNLHPGNKIHVRAFVVTTGGTIIYSTKSVSTCIARVASYMYQKSLASNYRGHEYLYKSILNVAQFVPAEKYTGYFTTKDNPYYRDSKVVYGWNDNLYTPDGDDYMNIKPDVFLGKDYLSATTGYSGDPASVNKNTRGGVISISGVKYDNGISTNANGYFEYSVPKNAKYFMGIAGIDDSVVSDANYVKASVKCEVSFDGFTAITTGVLTYGKSQYIKVEVPQGATKVTIKFNDAGDGILCDRASMGNAGWLVDKNY
ncbi:MAG: NPCBM/NEW2 domain-containing protein [Eubacterium sp.]